MGFFRGVLIFWFKLTGRKIRVLQAGELAAEGAELFAIAHPPGLLPAIAISLAFRGSVRCVIPQECASALFAGFLVRQLRIILYENNSPLSEENNREAVEALTRGESLAVFIDHTEVESSITGSSASHAAWLTEETEVQLGGRPVPIYPLHLFLPESNSHSREILIFIDAPLDRAVPQADAATADARVLASQIEACFQDNAFQLRTPDVGFLLSDLEDALRSSLREEWTSRKDWKQDTEGFVLSRFTSEGIRRMNVFDPDRLVALRESLDDYRGLRRKCALSELEVGGGQSPLGAGWNRLLAWIETVLGLPVAFYGLLNHWAIALVLFVAGSFKPNRTRSRGAEFALRAGVVLGFYILQTYLVAHHWGRAVAGYYAPSLPISGWYLWRYYGLIRRRARLLFVALTIPSLKRKALRSRQTLLNDLDRALASMEE